MAAENAAEHGPTAGEYIVHHLTHLQNQQAERASSTSRSSTSTRCSSRSLLGVLGCWLLWLAARKATSGVPGRFQAAVEILVEMVDSRPRASCTTRNSRKFVAPLALTVFVWIFLMNAMDLLPVDLLPVHLGQIYGAAGHDPHHAYLRVVPTADLSVTMGLSLARAADLPVLQRQDQGPGRLGARAVHRAVRQPLRCCGRSTSLMQIIEFVAKTVSHGMRLFGNMYAGELIFLLIALMGGAWSLSATGIGLAHRPHHRGHRLGDLPHPDHHAAGLRVHDADAGLPRPGPRRTTDPPHSRFPFLFFSSTKVL